jgi:hypothetical protein
VTVGAVVFGIYYSRYLNLNSSQDVAGISPEPVQQDVYSAVNENDISGFYFTYKQGVEKNFLIYTGHLVRPVKSRRLRWAGNVASSLW